MNITLDFIAETGSTSADLLDRLRAGEALPEGYWLVAARQGRGRGRQGRAWTDGEGNFMGSTPVRLAPGDPPAATLSFVCALSVYETLRHLAGEVVPLMLKWPNDILLGGAKLAGILLEREGPYVVVGIGVNLAGAPRIADRATTSLAACGSEVPRELFARALAENLARELARWRECGTEPLFRRWLDAAHEAGAPLVVHDPGGKHLSGTFDGLASDGALRLRLPDGSTHAIHAGEVMLEGKV